MKSTLLVTTNSKSFSDKVEDEFKEHFQVDVKKDIHDTISSLSGKPAFAVIDLSLPKMKEKDILELFLKLKSNRIRNFILLKKMDDLRKIEKLPLSTINSDHFLVRKDGKEEVDLLIEEIKKHLDPERDKKMKIAEFMPDEKAFYVLFWNDKEYKLKCSDISEIDDDKSNIVKVELDKNGFFFKVFQDSGNEHEVPWDLVLHHCEPEYEYFKGRQDEKEIENQNKKIGDSIKAIRQEKGVSTYQLAEMTGIKRPNITRLESGKHSPSIDTLEKISKALKVPLSKLF